MATENDVVNAPAMQGVTITRIFDAPRELVFKMWTDQKYVVKWWGPKNFTNPVCELDVKKGGRLYIVMQGPDGTQYPMSGIFDEIIEPEQIVFTSSAEDKDGHAMFEVVTTVTISDENGKTKLTMDAKVTKSTPQAAASLSGMNEGWNQSLDRLADTLRDVVNK